ncbi:MAG TPA: hypothetical protein VKP69_07615 [Isosphaeraceae bacterium]|nr:hypothetical protein [Isosphaeraceae bacterium]
MGNCSDKISREHIVSKSLFLGNVVRAEGFPWCKTGPKEVGLSSLTSKTLCKKHNNDISYIDSGGANAFNVFRQLRLVANQRHGLAPGTWQVVEYRINGPLLERWLLKTLINISYNGDYPIGARFIAKGHPNQELVEIVFGLRKFTGRAGLYFVVHTGQEVYSDDTVQFSPLIKDGAYIIGGLFSFRGFRLLLELAPEGPPQQLSGLGLNGEDWGYSQLNFHNQRINECQDRYLSQVVYLDW